MLSSHPFDLTDAAHHATAASLWTRACGSSLALSSNAIAYNTLPSRNAQQVGQFAQVDGTPVGFVLASSYRASPSQVPNGWIDAIAVAPEFQRQGIGQQLLQWAEAWLRAQGCAAARLGASLRWFAPGAFVELGDTFFIKRAYVPRSDAPKEWDLGLDLREYVSPTFLKTLNVEILPAMKTDIPATREFFTREFPGRWLYEFEQSISDGAAIAEYIILKSERGVDACCHITFENSVRRAERFYPTPLPHPWGQVGTIGVSADCRNAGYGSALLDAALKHLQTRGVRGCIIDWTSLVSYYERFGFKTHRAYHMLTKELH